MIFHQLKQLVYMPERFLYTRNRIICFVVIFFCGCNAKQATADKTTTESHSYYLNNSGNDNNDGSKSGPWKTIQQLNNVRLQPGDTVYFEAGQTFSGTIVIDSGNTGTSNKNIVITSSGIGHAIINGDSSTAMSVYKSTFISITGIEFNGLGRKKGNTKDGLVLNQCDNITLTDLRIHGFQKSGLLINACRNVEAKKILATENGFAGIYITGEWEKRNCSNIHLSYCTAENNPGDPTNYTNHSGNGILAGLCKNVLIEYCMATNNGWDMPRTGNGPVGIWCYEADSIIIQHCVSYKNKTSAGGADGGGFDIDGGVTNSVIQYCFSYENQGSGYGIFQYAGASKWTNNTIRYCISENDGSVSPAHAGVFIWNSSEDTSQFSNCFFYNNTVYNSKGAAISYEAKSKNAGFQFYNNIFVGKDSLILGRETNSVYLGNNWYSLADGFNAAGMKDFTKWANSNNKEKQHGHVVGFNFDPVFKKAGLADIILPVQLDSFINYQLPVSSLLRTNGLDLHKLFGIDNGGKAFNQNPAPVKGIGACF